MNMVVESIIMLQELPRDPPWDPYTVLFKPADILIETETWLYTSISSSEIFHKVIQFTRRMGRMVMGYSLGLYNIYSSHQLTFDTMQL